MTVTGLESFAAILLWMMPFVMGRHFRLGASIARRSLLSAAGGISVAYVFVDIMPQMNRMQEIVYKTSAELPLPFLSYRVYIFALIGFVTFYALENMVAVSRPQRQASLQEDTPFVCWVHIFGFALYSVLMGYLLSVETERTLGSLVLYSLAMFVHFWVVDHSLRMEHGDFYDYFGRWIIASAVLAGWTLGIAGVSSDYVLPTLMGFLGGGVVINSIKEELPEKGEGRVLPFVFGAFGYALLLLLIEARGITDGR